MRKDYVGKDKLTPDWRKAGKQEVENIVKKQKDAYNAVISNMTTLEVRIREWSQKAQNLHKQMITK